MMGTRGQHANHQATEAAERQTYIRDIMVWFQVKWHSTDVLLSTVLVCVCVCVCIHSTSVFVSALLCHTDLNTLLIVAQ
jgi:hypothetical protein